MQLKKSLLLSVFAAFSMAFTYAQQQADTTFTTEISNPLFSENGPVIAIDTLHNNFHTRKSGFAPFAKLVKQDGFKVIDFHNYDQLEQIDILVIANPIHPNNVGNWVKPILAAFNEKEIKEIKSWVESGGALFLIADHMPFAGAASTLAAEFGFDFCNGFANLSEKTGNRDVFSLQNGRLNLSGLTQEETGISKVYTFTGSAFTYPPAAISLLNFKASDVCLQPERAWVFNDSTPSASLKDMSQGAVLNYGKGKIAVFGEAAMFTAQTITQNGNTFKIGFNSPFADENVSFVREVLKWLSQEDANPAQREILETMDQMQKTFNKGNFKEVADYYTDDAQMIGNQVHIKGKEKIKDYWGIFSGQLTWKLESEKLIPLTENFVLQNGYSNVSYFDDAGKEQNSRSYFSLLWEKKDNRWKIKLDHFSPR